MSVKVGDAIEGSRNAATRRVKSLLPRPRSVEVTTHYVLGESTASSALHQPHQGYPLNELNVADMAVLQVSGALFLRFGPLMKAGIFVCLRLE